MNRLLQSFVAYDASGSQQPPRSSDGAAPYPRVHYNNSGNYGSPPPSLPTNDDQYETLDLDSIGSGQQHVHPQYPLSGPRSGSRGVGYARQQENGPFAAQFSQQPPPSQQQFASSTNSVFDQSGYHHQATFISQSSTPYHPSGGHHLRDHTRQASPPAFPPEANSFFSQDVHDVRAPLSSSSSSASHSFFADQTAILSSASDLFGSSDQADDFLSASYAPQDGATSSEHHPTPAFHYNTASGISDAGELFGVGLSSFDAVHTPLAHEVNVPAPPTDSSLECPPSAADLFGSPPRPTTTHLAKTSPPPSPVRHASEHVQAAFSVMQLNPLDVNTPSPSMQATTEWSAPSSPVVCPVAPAQTNPPSSPKHQLESKPTLHSLPLSPSKPAQPSPTRPSSSRPDVLEPKYVEDASLSTTPHSLAPSTTSMDHTKQLMLQYKQMAERLETEKNELLDILAAQADQFYAMQAYIDQLVAEKAAVAAP
ncbi:hypothetical protein H310_00662 [Aphanomyces invadans]|uniref:Uncharacterized protein n=1 Tax=Aphanomyces invadans TaxID=157072 RepID=A0A024UXD6_9STRA|nr:hypothetical protein H310_00662 [Aphanomyces invadans]ETW10338.1 hypothetical protein H310_00662 [Aphanomyces invadans]|eukprot:XP_008861749.1 hypothetical protein H310_00662 [Aphanomyces invadans]